MNVKQVVVFGTFDVIHEGHRFFLSEAAKEGDSLVAIVSRDTFVEKAKGKRPHFSEEKRLHDILKTGLVAEAVLGDEIPGSYTVLTRLSPCVVCLGHDQKDLEKSLCAWKAQHNKTLSLIILPPFARELYSSSRLNKGLS